MYVTNVNYPFFPPLVSGVHSFSLDFSRFFCTAKQRSALFLAISLRRCCAFLSCALLCILVVVFIFCVLFRLLLDILSWSQTCVRFFTSREDNAATRSVPSSGRWYVRSTESTPLELIRESPICSWSASMCITTRPVVGDMCPVRCSWTWSPALWTVCALVHMGRSSDPITSCSDRPELETTGPKVTTPKVPSSSTRSWMSCGRRRRAATACKVPCFIINSKTLSKWGLDIKQLLGLRGFSF